MTSALTDSDIERIAAGVLDLTHPYAEWTHAAHFAAALWLLRRPAVLRQHGGMEPIIRRYNEAVGVPNTTLSPCRPSTSMARMIQSNVRLPGVGSSFDQANSPMRTHLMPTSAMRAASRSHTSSGQCSG